jgi:hypothetical protein
MTSSGHAVHFTLQGKGGVGKSLISSVICQYLRERGADLRAKDTDPVNQTLKAYAALNAEFVKLLNDSTTVEARRFDKLLHEIVENPDAAFVIDNGASTFLPLWAYIVENDALTVLRSEGRRVVLHSVITGGQMYSDTMKGFVQLAEAAPDQSIVVWKNEFFGAIEEAGTDPKPFEETRAFARFKDKILGTVSIGTRNKDTFGKDLNEMLSRTLTFDEAIEQAQLMPRQRLRIYKADIWNQLDQVDLGQGIAA